MERRLAQLIDAITDAARDGRTGPPGSPDRGAVAGRDPLLNASETYLTVPEGTTYHRPGCLLLRQKDAGPADPAAISVRRLTPCPVCLPEQPSDTP